MSMNAFLAEHYGTGKTAEAQPSQDDFEKQASVELFCKLASDQGIDLNSLTDEQVQGLYDGWLNKEAEEEEKKEEEKKVEKAKEEHEEKKESAAKFAEADFLGRVMAHAFTDESEKIAAAKEAGLPSQLAGEANEYSKKGLHWLASKGRAAGKAVASATGASDLAEAARIHGKLGPSGLGVHPAHAQLAREARNEAAKRGAGRAAATLGGAAATLGGAAGAHRLYKKHKEGSALDELAFERAAELAASGGFDPAEAQSKIAAAFTLDLVEDSMKVASAPDLGTAVDIRALELLERVGYPITWNE